MNGFEDPPRLFEADDAPAELRSLLTEAQVDGLGLDATARVASGVEAQLIGPAGPSGLDGAGSPAPGTSAGGASSLGTSGATKLGAAVAVAAVALGAWWWAGQAPSETVTMAERQPTAALPVPTMAVSEPEAAGDGTAQEASEDAESSAQAQGPAPRPAGASQTAAQDHPTEGTDRAPQQDAVEEHRLLRAARASLDRDPRRSLALTEEHRRRFPRGMLVQEREVIAIEALAKLGKSDSARSRADQFAEDYPDSPHRGRVDGTSQNGSKKTPSHP